MKKRPHIILFNPDEMRWDTMSHMGNPAAHTPFLDQFARADAVSFSQAFCQNPVCVPSRCSLFTGLYPHVHGHRTMSHLLHPGESNLFSELKEAGYYVWMNTRNDLFAGQIPGWAESNANEIFYGGDCPFAPPPLNPPSRDGKYRFSHFEGQLGLDKTGKNYTDDDEAVDAAIRKIEAWDSSQPLCLFLGLMYPHVPYQVEEPYYSQIDRSKLPPRIPASACAGKSRMLELLRGYCAMDGFSEAEWDELRTVYLGMCAKIDHQFQRLCDGLKQAGLYDDCAIFFFSDHGDFAGDYDLVEKAQSSFEDCLTRVPLLIKPPIWETSDPGTTDSLAELVDLYATVMDYAGVQPGRTHFGRSLRPVVENRSSCVRDFVCCEGGRLPGERHCDEFHSSGPNGPAPNFVYWPKVKAQTDDRGHAKATMLRTKTEKYVSRITGEDEYYDLTDDPGERNNLIADLSREARITHLRLELLRWLEATSDVVPFAYDRRMTEAMMWHKVKNQCPPEYEQDVRKKISAGMKTGALMMYLESLRNGQ